jgi:hypothetical protein
VLHLKKMLMKLTVRLKEIERLMAMNMMRM